MNLGDLKQLIALLREQGVTEYSSEGFSIKLNPQVGYTYSGPVVPEAPTEPRKPEILKKLNPNYSHPALLKITDRG